MDQKNSKYAKINRDLLVTLLNSGMTITRIAKTFEVTRPVIYKAMEFYEVKKRWV